MPTCHGIEVSILDEAGVPLPEYGIQSLRNSRSTENHTTSCYIESKTDEYFKILVRHNQEAQNHNYVASIHFDSDDKVVRETLIVTDPTSPWFLQNRSILNYNYVVRNDTVYKSFWTFGEVGLESRLRKLDVQDSTSQDHVEKCKNSDVLELLKNTNLEAIKAEKDGIGQIVVKIRKFHISKRIKGDFTSPTEFATSETLNDSNSDNADAHVSHRTEGVLGAPMNGKVYKVYGDVHPGKPFITFKFYYRGKEILSRFGFIDGEKNSSRHLPISLKTPPLPITLKIETLASNKTTPVPLKRIPRELEKKEEQASERTHLEMPATADSLVSSTDRKSRPGTNPIFADGLVVSIHELKLKRSSDSHEVDEDNRIKNRKTSE